MRFDEPSFDREVHNSADDDWRWEAYRALMRKTGEIQMLPGLDDETQDDTWRPKPPVAADADKRETKALVETRSATEHLSYAPPCEVAAPAGGSVAGDLGLAARPARIATRGSATLIGAAALVTLLVLAAPSVLGPHSRHDMRPLASSAPTNRGAATSVAEAPNMPVAPRARPAEGPARTTVIDNPIVHPRGSKALSKDKQPAQPRHVSRSGAVTHHRTPDRPAQKVHGPIAAHADNPRLWTSPYPWADKRWNGGLSGGAAEQPHS
jgi:hypothetical protein